MKQIFWLMDENVLEYLIFEQKCKQWKENFEKRMREEN